VEFLKELFAHVFSSLMRNKLRSLLTMAGIAWGVASMVLIVAMGDGFKGGQRDRFRDIGENIVIVFNGRTEMQPGGRRAGRLIRLDYDDVREIRANCYWYAPSSPSFRAAPPPSALSIAVRFASSAWSRSILKSATSPWTAAASWWTPTTPQAPA